MNKLFFALVVLTLPQTAFSATDISADVSVDTTWNIGGSPYTVTKNDFTIDDGVTLTIDAGVQVNVDSQFIVKGALDINGTDGNEVVFTERVAGGWGAFQFSRDATAESSDIEWAEFNNLDWTLAIENESVTFSDCTFEGNSASRSFFAELEADNDSLDPDPLVTFEDSTFNYTNSTGSTNQGFVINGMNTVIQDSNINLTFSGGTGGGGAPGTVYAIQATRTGVGLYSLSLTGNSIDVDVTNNGKGTAYGLSVSGIAASITNNTLLDISAPNQIYGIAVDTQSTISGNTINLTSDDGSTDFGLNTVQGIYSTVSAASQAISNNLMTLSTTSQRNLTGMYLVRGSASNNRLVLNHDNAIGNVYGFNLITNTSDLTNNSVRFVVPNAQSVAGVRFASHANDKTVTIKNNIFSVAGTAAGNGILRSSSDATLSNTYNIFNNFDTTYSGTGVSAGTGELTSDPSFSNTSTLTLNNTSPAIDSGDWDSSFVNELNDNGGRINMGAFGNTASAVEANGGGTVIVAPEITTNSGENITQEPTSLTLAGRTSSSANTVEVNDATTGVTYTAGQTSWTYTNNSLATGVNNFSIRSRTAGGTLSTADTISVTAGDTTAPSVSSITPTNNATDVAIDSTIQVVLDDDVDATSVVADTSFTVSGGVTGSVNVSGSTITYTPDSDLDYETTYTVTLTTAIEDESDNALGSAYSSSFTTVADSSESSGESETSGDTETTTETAAASCSLQAAAPKNLGVFLLAFLGLLLFLEGRRRKHLHPYG